MFWIVLAAVFIAFFHLWLYLWYFPKHCLSDRKVTFRERYAAFFNLILKTLSNFWK